jgi:uncharacterized membrane protein YkgB
MKAFIPKFDLQEIDDAVISYLRRISLPILRYSLAIIFIWFGALKPLGSSPANDLIEKTVYWFDPAIFIPVLGIWEIAIGICLIVTPWMRVGLFLLALQMPGTFLPLVLRPEICFIGNPFNLTLEGQYIVKNLVLIGAALVVGSRISPLSTAKN